MAGYLPNSDNSCLRPSDTPDLLSDAVVSRLLSLAEKSQERESHLALQPGGRLLWSGSSLEAKKTASSSYRWYRRDSDESGDETLSPCRWDLENWHVHMYPPDTDAADHCLLRYGAYDQP